MPNSSSSQLLDHQIASALSTCSRRAPLPPRLCLFPLISPAKLQQHAVLALARAGRGAEHGADGLIKHRFKALLRESRALEVLDRRDLLGHLQTLGVRDRRHAALAQLLNRLAVVAEIDLGADKDDRRAGRVVVHLGVPLRNDIGSACRTTFTC